MACGRLTVITCVFVSLFSGYSRGNENEAAKIVEEVGEAKKKKCDKQSGQTIIVFLFSQKGMDGG